MYQIKDVDNGDYLVHPLITFSKIAGIAAIRIKLLPDDVVKTMIDIMATCTGEMKDLA